MGMMWKFGGMNPDGLRFGHFLIDGGEYHPNPPIMEKPVAQNFLSQSESLIFLQDISPERLNLLNPFFVWQFSIIIETYRISFGY